LAAFSSAFAVDIFGPAWLAPRYNIVPRQQPPSIVLDQFQPVLKLMRWGLIPAWAKDENCEP